MKGLLIPFLSLLLIACTSAEGQNGQAQDAKAKYQDLEVAEFEAKMAEDVIILDVRTPSETAEGKIEGAIEADVLNKDAFAAKLAELDPEATYLVYCRSGSRSVRACNQLSEAGFGNLYNLLGGYNAWSEAKE